MDNLNTAAATRFREIRQRLGYTQQKLAERLMLSRNYIAQIEMGVREPSIRVLNAIESLHASANRVSNESTPQLLKTSVKYRNSGTQKPSAPPPPGASSGTVVASRFPPESRSPSTRADVEHYMKILIEAAENSGNPNAWPVLHDRLKKRFPLDEWEPMDE